MGRLKLKDGATLINKYSLRFIFLFFDYTLCQVLLLVSGIFILEQFI